MNPIGDGPAEKSGPCEFANFSKLTSSPSWFAESQRKVAGGLHGQGTPEKTLSYKGSIIIGGNRDMWEYIEYIEIQKIFFPLHAVWAWKNNIKKVKASQDWAWWGTGKATRRASTSVSAGRTMCWIRQTNDIKMAKMHNAAFASVCTDKICLQNFQVPENRVKVCTQQPPGFHQAREVFLPLWSALVRCICSAESRPGLFCKTWLYIPALEKSCPD